MAAAAVSSSGDPAVVHASVSPWEDYVLRARRSGGTRGGGGVPELNDFICVGGKDSVVGDGGAAAAGSGAGRSSDRRLTGSGDLPPPGEHRPVVVGGLKGGEAWWGPLLPQKRNEGSHGEKSPPAAVVVPPGCPAGLEALAHGGLEGLLGSDLADMGLTWETRPWWRAVDQV